MTCEENKSIRPIVKGLFAAGKERQAVFHRREACNHASQCGGWCRWLVKGVGVNEVGCAHPSHGGLPWDLKLAFENESAKCPEGRW